MIQVLYTAAHGVEGSEFVPLGGGATICRWLMEEWERTGPFEVRVLGPAVLGVNAPGGRDLVSYSESQYARFCRRFELAVTEEVLRHDPAHTVVLANDVSEGPDFERLAGKGFRIATIYHVDVVAYVASIYGKGIVEPQTTTRWYERVRRLPMPDVLRLVWEKQRASVHHSSALIVPSGEMRTVLERCYPRYAPGKVHVIPWGARPAEPASEAAMNELRKEFAIPAGAHVLLTLSRISPEKGQDVLLEALAQWEREPGFPSAPVCLFLCGEAAYMQGQRYLRRLHDLASKLRRVKTFFPGHVTGERKRAFFGLADLYIFPSLHESYGLTLMEALEAGLPAVCLDHHGSREVMRPEFGIIAKRGELHKAIASMLSVRPAPIPSTAIHRFEEAAAGVAKVVAGVLP